MGRSPGDVAIHPRGMRKVSHMNVGARDYSRAPALFTYIRCCRCCHHQWVRRTRPLARRRARTLRPLAVAMRLRKPWQWPCAYGNHGPWSDDASWADRYEPCGNTSCTDWQSTKPLRGLCRPPQHPVWDAVGKINALNSAHEIIPKSTPSVKKNSNVFSQELGNTRCCGGIFSF